MSEKTQELAELITNLIRFVQAETEARQAFACHGVSAISKAVDRHEQYRAEAEKELADSLEDVFSVSTDDLFGSPDPFADPKPELIVGLSFNEAMEYVKNDWNAKRSGWSDNFYVHMEGYRPWTSVNKRYSPTFAAIMAEDWVVWKE